MQLVHAPGVVLRLETLQNLRPDDIRNLRRDGNERFGRRLWHSRRRRGHRVHRLRWRHVPSLDLLTRQPLALPLLPLQPRRFRRGDRRLPLPLHGGCLVVVAGRRRRRRLDVFRGVRAWQLLLLPLVSGTNRSSHAGVGVILPLLRSGLRSWIVVGVFVRLDSVQREPTGRVAIDRGDARTLPVLPLPLRLRLGLHHGPEERWVRRGAVCDHTQRPLKIETVEPILLSVLDRFHRRVFELPHAVESNGLFLVRALDDEPVAPIAGSAAHRVVLIRPRVVRQQYELRRHARRAVAGRLVEVRHRGVEVRIRAALDSHQVPPPGVHVLGANHVKLGILRVLLGGETLPLGLDRLDLLLRPELLVADAPVVILEFGVLFPLTARARDAERGHVRADHRGSGQGLGLTRAHRRGRAEQLAVHPPPDLVPGTLPEHRGGVSTDRRGAFGWRVGVDFLLAEVVGWIDRCGGHVSLRRCGHLGFTRRSSRVRGRGRWDRARGARSRSPRRGLNLARGFARLRRFGRWSARRTRRARPGRRHRALLRCQIPPPVTLTVEPGPGGSDARLAPGPVNLGTPELLKRGAPVEMTGMSGGDATFLRHTRARYAVEEEAQARG